MILFVRHGQTDYNKQGRVQGWLDVPLNEEGLSQAEIISEKLKDYNFTKIYSSPLMRARRTAEIINTEHNKEIIFDDRLKEFFLGSMQGELFASLDEKERKHFLEFPEDFGAESNLEFFTRTVSFLSEILDDEGDVLIVSHGGVYRNLYRFINNITDLNSDVKGLSNCEIAVLKK